MRTIESFASPLPPLERGKTTNPFVITETIDQKGRSVTLYPTLRPEPKPFVTVTLPKKEVESQAKDVLASHIAAFDKDWKKLGLPRNWHELSKKVGFSMKSQMALLEGTEPHQIALWVERTVTDLKGFFLEYLDSDHVVYPVSYELVTDEEGNKKLIDKKYQKSPSEMTSKEERNGEVKGALETMEHTFLSDDTPLGALAVMGSSKGPTGLKMDDGTAIRYDDSYYFIWQKTVKNGKVSIDGVTIQTDFSLQECQSVVEVFKKLNPDVETTGSNYVNMLSLLTTQDPPLSIADIVKKLQSVRKDNLYRSHLAYKNKTWGDILQDIENRDLLYDFDTTTEELLTDFVLYSSKKGLTEKDLQKGLAATLLRAGKHFLIDEKQEVAKKPKEERRSVSSGGYGGVMGAMEQATGCNGGGGVSVMSGGVERLGAADKGEGETVWVRIPNEYGSLKFSMSIAELAQRYPFDDSHGVRYFKCEHCGVYNVRPYESLIPKCMDCEKSALCEAGEFNA